MSKLSAKHHQESLLKFIDAVRASRVETDEDFKKVQDLQIGFSANEQGFFMFTEDVLRTRQESASSIAKAIGGDILHDKDVQDAIWKAAMLAVDAKSAQLPEIVRACLKGIEEELGNTRHIICRNELVYLEGGNSLSIGPVRVVTGSQLITEMASKPFSRRFNLFVGEPSIVMAEGGQISAGISANCWLVETNTSKANERAAAEWLIDVAVSLLRLSSLPDLGQFAPKRGEIEPNPITNPPRDFVISFDEKQFTLPGSGISPKYVVGKEAFKRCKSKPFKRASSAIFTPQSGSLAERFQRCLGWQTKARQARDRSERFLFFFTSLEALLAQSDITSPIIDTVARSCASLLGDNPEHRANNCKLVKSLYQTRSRLVHAGSRAVTDREQKAVQEVAEYVSSSVLNWADLSESYATFQDQLRQASFGKPFRKSQKGWL